MAPGCLRGTGALARALVINGNPVTGINLIAEPQRTVVVMMKDGTISKSLETAG